VTAPTAPAVAAPTPTASTHNESFASRKPAPRHQTPHVQPPAGPQPGTFTINAPVLGTVGSAAVKTADVQRLPGGSGYVNESTFSAETATGESGLEQSVQINAAGVISANLTPSVPVPPSSDALSQSSDTAAASTYLHSSVVTTTPTDDGNVLVDVQLVVLPGTSPVSAAQGQQGNSLSIDVQALYTSNVVLLLAESVFVAEGSTPCCVTSTNTAPRSSAIATGTSTLPISPTAVGSAAVSPMSTNRRDDQVPLASS